MLLTRGIFNLNWSSIINQQPVFFCCCFNEFFIYFFIAICSSVVDLAPETLCAESSTAV